MRSSVPSLRIEQTPAAAGRPGSLSELLVYAETAAASAFWRSLHRFWIHGFAVSGPVSFAFAVSLVWAAFYNGQFWRLTMDAMGHAGAGSAVFLGTLIVFVVTAQATLLLLVPTRRAQKIAVAALFLVAALSSYFAGAYGAIFNREMMRNVLETDAAEVGGLMNADLVAHALVFGVLPALIVSRARMPASGWRSQLKRRGTALVIAWLIVIAGLFAASANYAVFFRQHKPNRDRVPPDRQPWPSLCRAVSATIRNFHAGVPIQRVAAMYGGRSAQCLRQQHRLLRLRPSRQIEILRTAADRFDTLLIYASDHGESLGERGVYLHGMPYAFAPEDQKRVPMLMWTSAAFRSRMGLDDSCLRKHSHDNVSHDNLYHTVLGAAGLTNKIYDPQLDLLKRCRDCFAACLTSK